MLQCTFLLCVTVLSMFIPKNLFVFTHREIMNGLPIKRMVKLDFE